jgi:tol-pal system protein YbgF
MFGKAIQRAAAFSLCSLLSISLVPRLKGIEEELRITLPEAVITSPGESRAIEYPEITLPVVVAQGVKEEPEVETTAAKEEKATPTTKRPGCAYWSSLSTSAGDVLEAERALFTQGKQRYVKGDYGDAAESFEKLIINYSKSPLLGSAYYWLGESKLHLNQLEEALGCFLEVIDRYPRDNLIDYSYYSAGWIHFKRGEYETAYRFLDQAYRVRRDGPVAQSALFWSGESLLRMNNHRGGLDRFHDVVDEFPQGNLRIETQYLIGANLFHLGRFGEAERAFRDFNAQFAYHPLLEHSLYGLGWSLVSLGGYGEAASVFQEFLLRFPESPLTPITYYGLVKSCVGQGEMERAIQYHRELAERYIQSTWGRRALNEIASSYFQEGEFHKAIESYRELVKLYPMTERRDRVYFTIGESFYHLEDYRNARNSYQLLIDGYPDSPLVGEASFKIGLSHFQEKSYKEAIYRWKGILSRDPHFSRRDEVIYWIGKTNLLLRNYDEATSFFGELKHNDFYYAKALNSLGWYYFQLGRWRNAASYFNQLIETYPEHALVPEATVRVAEAYVNLEQYERALDCLVRLTHGDYWGEKLDKAYFLTGWIRYRQGLFPTAMEQFQHILRELPNSPYADEAHFWLGMSYFRKGAFAEAADAFSRLVNVAPSSPLAPQARLKMGDSYYNLGEYLRARLAYLQVIKDYPGSKEAPEAEYGVILSYYRVGEYDHFIEKTEEFFGKYPEHILGANVGLQLAEFHEENGQWEEAISAYREMLRTYPRGELADEAQFRIGEIYMNMRWFPEAIAAYEKIPRQFPDSSRVVEAWYKIGESYYALEDFRSALKGYERVIYRFPKSGWDKRSYLKASECYRVLKKPRWAVKTLKRLIALYPNDPVVYEASLNLGMLYFHDRDYRGAIASFQKASDSPDEATAALAQLRIGDAHVAVGDEEAATREFMKIPYLYPDRAEYVEEALLKVGRIYMNHGRWSEAHPIYQRLVRTAQSEQTREIAGEMLERVEKEMSQR